MADVEPEFETADQLGFTKQFTGSVGTSSTAVPTIALTTKIETILIRSPNQSPQTRDVQFNLMKFKVLFKRFLLSLS